MDTEKKNAMYVNPKHKWCMKKNLVKNLKTKNFSVLIGRALIEYQSNQAEARLENFGNFQLIENHTWSIEILEN